MSFDFSPYTNQAEGYLDADITAVATSLALQSGEGSDFPATTGSEVFAVMVGDAANGYEYMTGVRASGDTISSLSRAAEDGSRFPAKAFPAGTPVINVLSGHYIGELQTACEDMGHNAFTFGGAKTFSESVTVGDGTGQQLVRVDGGAGNNRSVVFRTNGVNRWLLYANSTAEGGSNAGSDFWVAAHDDAGTFIDTPMRITRAAGGVVRFNRPVEVNAQDFTVDTSTLAVDSSNNRVGIGTAAPAALLDVNGDAFVAGNLTIGDAATAPWLHVDVLDDATSRFGTISVGLATNYAGWIRYQTTGGSEWFSSGVTTGGSPIECWRIQRTASPNFQVLVDAQLDADLAVDTTTLVVDSTNNRVGIGTASPAVLLDVNGAANFAGNVTMADAVNIVLNTTTGSQIGTAAGQKVAFHGATPVDQAAITTAAVASHSFSASFSDMELEDACDDLGAAINEIRTVLIDKGLMAAA